MSSLQSGEQGDSNNEGSQDGGIQNGGDTTSTVSSDNGLVATSTTTVTADPTSSQAGLLEATAGATTAATRKDNTPYSSGDLAGAIVGAALGAALITFLVTFLFFRRLRQRHSSYRPRKRHDHGPAVFVEEKALAKRDVSYSPWQAYLHQPADDRATQTDVKAFFDQVDLHVENFYRKASLKPDSDLAVALSRVDSEHLPASIEEMIQNSRLTKTVIKHVVAYNLVSRMSPSANTTSLLLPAHLTMNPTKLDANTLRSQEAPAARQAYSEWKRLSAYLCPTPVEGAAFTRSLAVASSEISDAINAAFAPWRADSDENTFHQHERGLITLASNVAIKLMSQPWDYKFTWQEDVKSSIVVFPGLLKTTDESGRLLQSAQMLVAPTVVRL